MRKKINLYDKRLTPSRFVGPRREFSQLDEWVYENFQSWGLSDDKTEMLLAGKDGKTFLTRYHNQDGLSDLDECVAVYQMQSDASVTVMMFQLNGITPLNDHRQYIAKRTPEITLTPEQAQVPLKELRMIAMHVTADEIGKIIAVDPNDKRLESLATFHENTALAAHAAQKSTIQKPRSFKAHDILGYTP